MIIDTSALIAILRDEPDARDCALAIEKSADRRYLRLILLKPPSSSTAAAMLSPADVSMISSMKPAS